MFIVKIKDLFSIEILQYAFYISFGVLVSQLSQIYVYYSKGSKSLGTWFLHFSIFDQKQSISTTTILCITMAILLFFAISFLLFYARALPALAILKYGIAFIIIVCIASNIIFSSVMRFFYESIFCSLALCSVILQYKYLSINPLGVELLGRYNDELSGMLKFVIAACMGVPIVIGGAAFITSFYQGEKSIIQLQLYRHVYMTIYFEIGMVVLLIYPICRKIFSIRGL